MYVTQIIYIMIHVYAVYHKIIRILFWHSCYVSIVSIGFNAVGLWVNTPRGCGSYKKVYRIVHNAIIVTIKCRDILWSTYTMSFDSRWIIFMTDVIMHFRHFFSKNRLYIILLYIVTKMKSTVLRTATLYQINTLYYSVF